MAKRKRKVTEESINRKIKEGRSQGIGKDYIPFIRIPDIPSKGISTKTFNTQTQRQHHMLSRLENNFYKLCWWEGAKDIREQYAILDMDETVKIAHELGYKHPTAPGSKVIVPVTTDFLLDFEIKKVIITLARTTKYKKDLNDPRVLEKLKIEQVFWTRRNVDWGIVTEEMINPVLVENINWVYKARTLKGIPDLNINKVAVIEHALRAEILKSNRRITEISSKISYDLNLIPGTALFVVRYLIANRIWEVDMYKPITPLTSLELLGVNLEVLKA